MHARTVQPFGRRILLVHRGFSCALRPVRILTRTRPAAPNSTQPQHLPQSRWGRCPHRPAVSVRCLFRRSACVFRCRSPLASGGRAKRGRMIRTHPPPVADKGCGRIGRNREYRKAPQASETTMFLTGGKTFLVDVSRWLHLQTAFSLISHGCAVTASPRGSL